MLKEAADNADNLDVFRVSLDSRNQTADTTDNHFDLHARLGSLHQLGDDCFICQGVDLDADIALFALFCMCNFFVYHLKHPVLQAFRCNQKKVSLFHGLAL